MPHPARLLLTSFALSFLAACGGGSDPGPPLTAKSTSLDMAPVAVQATASPLPAGWYRDAVFIEIYLRGYQDSDGDGTGDINGLISRLDYLKSLGVTGIWLMPIFKSGTHDHNYDVADYRGLDPEFGSEADLKRLFDAAHARGIGVVLDYVMNHSSSANPLFYDATHSLASKRDWYVWRTTQPNWYWWTTNPWRPLGNLNYYFAIFAVDMPDFNLTNEAVVQYHFNSMQKWLNLGADGFRLDAVQGFVEDGSNTDNTPATLALLGRIRTTIDQYPNRFMVCEDGTQPTTGVQNGCASAFFFGLHSALMNSAISGKVDAGLASYLTDANLPNMSTLLANHDTFAGMRLYNQFNGNEARYKLAAASLLTLPGTPFIYYGEEIGMSISTAAGPVTDHELRPPMSWSSAPANAGFSTGTPFRAIADNAATHNVALETNDPNSLLSTYKELIALRNGEVALRRGTIALLPTGNDAVLAYTRTQGSERMLVVINYADTANTVSLTLPGSGTWAGRYPTGTASVSTDGSAKASFSLPPTTVRVFKLG